MQPLEVCGFTEPLEWWKNSWTSSNYTHKADNDVTVITRNTLLKIHTSAEAQILKIEKK